MKIVVCVRQGLDGNISPFDACAYEEALKLPGADITLLSMGKSGDFLWELTRLGAARAVLLRNNAFAGADTLATAYALSKAIERLEPDYVFCGRQTLIGDTGQTPPMLAENLQYPLIANVMEIREISREGIVCHTRHAGAVRCGANAVLTVERINTLRLPRLRSRRGELLEWTAADIGAEPARCGLTGSPTRVLETFENRSGKRKCTYITRQQLPEAIAQGLARSRERGTPPAVPGTLSRVAVVGEEPMPLARSLSRELLHLEPASPDAMCEAITRLQPSAVLWGSDAASRETAARVAARLRLGLCADCTRLEGEGERLLMYRPALSGSIMAKIESRTLPAMATVRTRNSSSADIILGLGYGVKDHIPQAKALARELGASLAASRRLVDNDHLPYEYQVGLTGTVVSPPVYIAAGISGAIHHLVGMQSAGTVIAINPDRNAPIFAYADFGIVDTLF